jgi:hypothetical protein
MKKILKPLIIIPNLPFILALSIYILVNLYRHSSLVERELREDLITPEVKKHMEEIYPKHFRYAVAIVFYGWILINLVL